LLLVMPAGWALLFSWYGASYSQRGPTVSELASTEIFHTIRTAGAGSARYQQKVLLLKQSLGVSQQQAASCVDSGLKKADVGASGLRAQTCNRNRSRAWPQPNILAGAWLFLVPTVHPSQAMT
jgi:hypothetical protein